MSIEAIVSTQRPAMSGTHLTELSAEEHVKVLGGTAARLFGFVGD